jgi:hypothetical protein
VLEKSAGNGELAVLQGLLGLKIPLLGGGRQRPRGLKSLRGGGWLASAREVVLQKSCENTRLGWYRSGDCRRAFLQIFHHDHAELLLDWLGTVPLRAESSCFRAV